MKSTYVHIKWIIAGFTNKFWSALEMDLYNLIHRIFSIFQYVLKDLVWVWVDFMGNKICVHLTLFDTYDVDCRDNDLTYMHSQTLS